MLCILGLRLEKLRVVDLIEHNAVAPDVDEEGSTVSEAIIHLLQGVDDEVYRRLQILSDRSFTVQAFVCLLPVIKPIGQFLLIDDNQQVEIRLISFRRVRFIDPAAPCV
ncbi:MAG: hypothetical protein A3H25_13805 [Sphingomonadales bacterium RIFCSPLOWO2_12_FULL_63_15]|nr:MAG: hypothetical protein A3H25_13805 [Sphingomonadales bacterium RIFCSPLOWO2_12_FULL_63_15]